MAEYSAEIRKNYGIFFGIFFFVSLLRLALGFEYFFAVKTFASMLFYARKQSLDIPMLQ